VTPRTLRRGIQILRGRKKSSFVEIYFSDESQDEDGSALPDGVPNPYYNRFENEDYTI